MLTITKAREHPHVVQTDEGPKHYLGEVHMTIALPSSDEKPKGEGELNHV